MIAYQVLATLNFQGLELCTVIGYYKEQTFRLVNCDSVESEQVLRIHLQCLLIFLHNLPAFH